MTLIDSRFFKKNAPLTLGEIALLIQVPLNNDDDSDKIIYNIARLDNATSEDISFYHNAKYKNDLVTSKAGFIIIKESDAALAPKDAVLFITPTPYRAYAKIAQYFYGVTPSDKASIAATAVVHSSVSLGKNVVIGDYVVLQEGVVVGDHTTLDSFVHLAKNVRIGDHCHLEAHVNIQASFIGNHVHIKSGAKLGQRGFGFDMDEKGPIDIPQLGRVIVEDYVEIGSNTTIDRGSLNDTVIGKGSRIDNLVQIAHNVNIGKYCIIIAQAGIAGSTTLGDGVVVAGQAGLSGHLNIGSGVRIAAQSGVMRDIDPKTDVAGTPSVPARDWHKQTIALKRLIQGKCT